MAPPQVLHQMAQVPHQVRRVQQQVPHQIQHFVDPHFGQRTQTQAPPSSQQNDQNAVGSLMDVYSYMLGMAPPPRSQPRPLQKQILIGNQFH